MILHDEDLIKEYTEKGFWVKSTLLDVFSKNVEDFPEREALVDPPNRTDLVGSDAERLNYRQLGRIVDSVAAELQDAGVEKDNIVLVQLPNIWELAMLYLAIAKAGGIISPMPMQWRSRELKYVAGLTKAKHYITVEEFKGYRHAETGREVVERVITLEELRDMASKRRKPKEVGINAYDVFTICWTSGTEADPKGCPMTHNNWYYISSLRRAMGVPSNPRILCVAPLVNMTGIGVNYIPWLVEAGTLVLHHPFTPDICLRQLVEERINFTILVPAVLNMILKFPGIEKFDLSVVKTITTGSAPPSKWIIDEFKRRWGIDIVNIWGQNEGTGLVAGPLDVPDTAKRVDHFPNWGKECGWKSGVKGIEIKIVDEEGRELTKPGEVGELLYRSPGVIPGYFNRPDLTAKAFVEYNGKKFFRTGDIFVIKDECHIGFYDRKKDVINRGGFKISAAEVENALVAHPKVLEVAAVGMPDEILGERVCIFVVPRGKEPPTLEELRDYLKEKGFAIYKLPEKLIIINEIPRNPVGKILKSKLKEIAAKE